MTGKETMAQFRGKVNAMYTHTLQRTYFRLFGRPVERRFAVIGNARTGSNYLLDGLKSSPVIRVYHEIFASHNREVGKDFDRIFATLFQPESRVTQIVGFKVFYNHLTEEEWQKLVACRDLQVIHLTRRNRLRTVISLEIAFKTGKWTQSGHSGAPKEKRVTLDPETLIQRLEQVEAGEQATRARFCDRPMLEIVYEDLVQSPQAVFESIGAYLGVDGIDPARIRLQKQNPEPPEGLILNYDEVVTALERTRFAEYLDG